MSAKLIVIATACGAFIAQAQTISLSGHVSKRVGGAAIPGANVALIGQSQFATFTNANGDFTISSTVSGLKSSVLSQSAEHFRVDGNNLVFSLPLSATVGNVEFFAGNGKSKLSFALPELDAGMHGFPLPNLGTGVYFMRVRLDEVTRTYKLVKTIGGSMALGNAMEPASATRENALAKTAAAVDTLRVYKAGYKYAKFAIDAYVQQNIQILMDTLPTCAIPAMPAGSTLPAIAELPDPFKYMSGTRVTSPDDWACRQKELSAMIAYYEYGPYPSPAPTSVTGTLSGTTLTVTVVANGKTISFPATVSLPTGAGPFPAFISLYSATIPAATLTARGIAQIVLPTAAIAADVKPNPATYPLNRTGVVYTLYGANSGISALMAWGWAAGRILDVLPTAIPQINATKVAIQGFSRWGKGALVTGAYDDRFALVCPSSSGSGGVGTYRNAYGVTPAVQTLTEIIGEAPQWFGDRFTLADFGSAKENHLPFDAHSTVSLIAPRPVIITEGNTDSWNNPPGPNLSAQAARIVYTYLGVRDYIGFKGTPNSGHAFSTQHQAAVLAYADRFLLGKNVRTDTIFDLPYTAAQTKAATLLPWIAP